MNQRDAIHEAYLLDGHDPEPALGQVLDVLTEGDTTQETADPTHGATQDVIVPEGGETPLGWPAAVPVRRSNWDLDLGTYRVASGDTLSGLAATYLGAPERWPEIWQPNKATVPNPDRLGAVVLNMPNEAVENMRAFVALGEPGVDPGQLTDEQKKKAQPLLKRFGLPFAIAGVGATAALGYFMLR